MSLNPYSVLPPTNSTKHLADDNVNNNNNNNKYGDSLIEYDEVEPFNDKENNDEEEDLLQSRGSKANVSDLLKTMIPKRIIIENNEKYVQYPSIEHIEREDVINLQNRLDQLLQERQARDNGLCPVREELYSQCFDELIRQVTIENPQRGLLLMRIRDEVKMTLAAYQSLYESSIIFGTRKTLQAEHGNVGLVEKIQELKERKAKLTAELHDQQSKYDLVERQTAEERANSDKKRSEEKDFLRHQAQNLENFLKTIIN